MFNEVKYNLKMKHGSAYYSAAQSEFQKKNYPSAIDYICRAENCYKDAYSMACADKTINNANAKEAIKRARTLKQKALDAFNQSIMG